MQAARCAERRVSGGFRRTRLRALRRRQSRMSRGVPSSAAQVRLRDAVQRECDDLRDDLRHGLLWTSVLAQLGHSHAAAGVLAEQKLRVDRFEHRIAAAIAAAAAEREAEDVVARVVNGDPPRRVRARPVRVAFAAATSLVTAATGALALRAPGPAQTTAVVAAAPTLDDETVAIRHRAARDHLSSASRAIASLASGTGDVEVTAARAHASVLAAAARARSSGGATATALGVGGVDQVLTEVVPLLQQEHDLLAALAADGDFGALRALEGLHELVATLVAIEPTLAQELPQLTAPDAGTSTPVEAVEPPAAPVAPTVAPDAEVTPAPLPEPSETSAEPAEQRSDEAAEPRADKTSAPPREEPSEEEPAAEPSDDGEAPDDEPSEEPSEEPSDDGLLGFNDIDGN